MTQQKSEETDSYYGQPIIKEPVWKPVIPLYFFTGGLAGASAGLAFAAGVQGRERLARNATFIGLTGLAVSPALLIVDLGKPARFLNMLRVFKVTSPMSVGSWLLTGAGGATGLSALLELVGASPRLKAPVRMLAALLGMPLATYTAALLADTAVPAWHEARLELPFVFGGSAAASAGAAAILLTDGSEASAAQRMAIGGAAVESLAALQMETGLGPLLSEPYRQGATAILHRAARLSTLAGAGLLAAAGKRTLMSKTGAVLLLAGSLAQRWAVFEAGRQSARDPKYTVIPQKAR